MSASSFTLFREMKRLPPLTEGLSEVTSETQVSLLIPCKGAAHALEKTVSVAHAYLSHAHGESFEIVLIPTVGPGLEDDPAPAMAEALSARFTHVRSVPHTGIRGKGAAIRTGVQASRGQWLYFTDGDLPYDLTFFDGASEKLARGYHLVTGNRRLPTSQFDLPVDLLKIAHARHRLGLAFNRVVRWLLPLATTDTQAGIKAFSRQLAARAFQLQTCPGFFFDLELFLTAKGHRYPITELPVTLHLNSEKSTVRVLRESVLAGFWLSRITWQNLCRKYGQGGRIGILHRYQVAPLKDRIFLALRWWLTPYLTMAERLPVQGKILDWGCGHGLLSLAIALKSPEREVLGVDHDVARVKLAQSAAQDLPRLKFAQGTMTTPPGGKYQGIAMIDVMHYFDPETQRRLLTQAFQSLEPGGTLIVREVNPNGGMVSRWNRLYEKIATSIGFTRSDEQELYFRTREGWESLLSEIGFKVRSENCSSPLFADILYVCEKNA